MLKQFHPGLNTIRRIAMLALMSAIVAVILAACAQSAGDTPSDITIADAPGSDESTPTAQPDTAVPPAPDPTPQPAVDESDETVDVEPEFTPEPEPTPGGPEPTPGNPVATPEPESEPEPELEPLELPDAADLSGMNHMYQTFNNCSAASVCMLLSHYDIIMDQETLRPIMRPNDGTRHGKNEYMIQFFREQGLQAHLMHGGDVETLQALIANDIPVIVQQWLEPDSDPIGHYSVVRGYDDNAGVFRLNDSMHGEDFRITYDEFISKWRAFSYRYIPVYLPDQQEVVDRILGDEVDLAVNRERSIEMIAGELEQRPDDAELIYSLGTNLHDLGRYDEAIEAYERARSIGLPPKMLWYVYWPAEAYNETGRHEDAIRVAEEQIASAQTFGDMRYERARALESLGQTDRAIAEYNQALRDDPKLDDAEDALIRLGAR
jgi:hypothetical protein